MGLLNLLCIWELVFRNFPLIRTWRFHWRVSLLRIPEQRKENSSLNKIFGKRSKNLFYHCNLQQKELPVLLNKNGCFIKWMKSSVVFAKCYGIFIQITRFRFFIFCEKCHKYPQNRLGNYKFFLSKYLFLFSSYFTLFYMFHVGAETNFYVTLDILSHKLKTLSNMNAFKLSRSTAEIHQ